MPPPYENKAKILLNNQPDPLIIQIYSVITDFIKTF